MVHKLKEDIFWLTKTVVSYLASIKELEIQIALIFACLAVKPRENSTNGTIANLKNKDQILSIRAESKKEKDDHLKKVLGEKMPIPQSKKGLSQIKVDKENKKMERIFERLINKAKVEKYGLKDSPRQIDECQCRALTITKAFDGRQHTNATKMAGILFIIFL